MLCQFNFYLLYIFKIAYFQVTYWGLHFKHFHFEMLLMICHFDDAIKIPQQLIELNTLNQ